MCRKNSFSGSRRFRHRLSFLRRGETDAPRNGAMAVPSPLNMSGSVVVQQQELDACERLARIIEDLAVAAETDGRRLEDTDLTAWSPFRR